MHIARQETAQKIKISKTMTVYEYPLLDNAIHGASVKITGRYPEKGWVVNEVCRISVCN